MSELSPSGLSDEEKEGLKKLIGSLDPNTVYYYSHRNPKVIQFLIDECGAQIYHSPTTGDRVQNLYTRQKGEATYYILFNAPESLTGSKRK